MRRRCVGSAVRQSKNCQKHSTTSLTCIKTVRVCNGTTLRQQTYTAKPQLKVWHQLETS